MLGRNPNGRTGNPFCMIFKTPSLEHGFRASFLAKRQPPPFAPLLGRLGTVLDRLTASWIRRRSCKNSDFATYILQKSRYRARRFQNTSRMLRRAVLERLRGVLGRLGGVLKLLGGVSDTSWRSKNDSKIGLKNDIL